MKQVIAAVAVLTLGLVACDNATPPPTDIGRPEIARYITVFEGLGGAAEFDHAEVLRVAHTYPSLVTFIETTDAGARDSAVAFVESRGAESATSDEIATPYTMFGFSDVGQASDFQELIATYEGVAAAVGPNGPKLGRAHWNIDDSQISELRSSWWTSIDRQSSDASISSQRSYSRHSEPPQGSDRSTSRDVRRLLSSP